MTLEVKINSVNFICDWKYNIEIINDKCCFCMINIYEDAQKRAKPKCILQSHGLTIGTCGHISHLYCYKKEAMKKKSEVNPSLLCGLCNEYSFVFDRNLETPNKHKLYKL
jgi:hypothetical protein